MDEKLEKKLDENHGNASHTIIGLIIFLLMMLLFGQCCNGFYHNEIKHRLTSIEEKLDSCVRQR